jgi:hypothetical protein
MPGSETARPVHQYPTVRRASRRGMGVVGVFTTFDALRALSDLPPD